MFDTQYQLLNPKQREAVDAIEGPVLVIAGPGTGKTQLLSMRVANIMRSSNADASNIVCLTFTNKAATNMRKRLLRLAGQNSTRVTVKTFHGFAAEIMANYPDYFWNGAKLSTAPDALQLEIVQNILSALPLDNPLALRFSGKFTMTGDVIKSLQLAKEAGLTPDKLRALLQINLKYIDVIEPKMIEILSQTLSVKKLTDIQSAISELPKQGIQDQVAPILALDTVIQESLAAAMVADEGTGKTKSVGKWKAKWIQSHNGTKGMHDERKRNNWWLALCDVYEQYRTQLHQHGYYDYSDMLLEVITQLEQRSDLLADVQERFQYVLIDEFQDCNAAQLRLAHLIASHPSTEGAPNIMAVGDDDQSIYAFNGAELNNMLFFERTYARVTQIVLTDNYRSSQAVLDTSDKIIDQAGDRLVKRVPGLSKTLTARNAPSQAGLIQSLVFETREQQLSEVARMISAQQGKGSIAVLARGHESLRQLSGILQTHGVPIRYEQQQNILEHPVVVQIITLSELVVAIQDGDKDTTNTLIAKLIRNPAWGFTAHELWELAVDNRFKPDWLGSLCDSTKHKTLGEWLLWLPAYCNQLPVARSIELLLGLTAGEHMTSPLHQHYAADVKVSNEYLQTLSAIRILQSLAKEFSNNENVGLTDFLRYIHINQQNEKGIADMSTFVSGPDALELLSVHKAKGLEFDYVYIIDAIESNWKPKTYGRKPPANLPLQPPGDQEDDYIRLLYVAATRAKHSLFVTSYSNDAASNVVLTAPYVQNAIDATEAEQNLDVITVLEENIRWPRLHTTDEKMLLADLLENYKLSATHLVNFLDVTEGGPQHFFEQNLLRLPQASTPHLAYGSAMHSAMQMAQKLTNQSAFDLQKVTEWYVRTLELEHLNPSDFERYSAHGVRVLQRLFTDFGYALPEGAQAEQYFSDVKLGDAVLTGAIDRLHNDNGLQISDYKTGGALQSFTTKDQTKAIKAWRHKTQLIFYTVLLQHSSHHRNAQNITAEMVYLEAEQAKDLVRAYTASVDDIERMQKLITVVWQKIMNLDFPETGQVSGIDAIVAFENELLGS